MYCKLANCMTMCFRIYTWKNSINLAFLKDQWSKWHRWFKNKWKFPFPSSRIRTVCEKALFHRSRVHIKLSINKYQGSKITWHGPFNCSPKDDTIQRKITYGTIKEKSDKLSIFFNPQKSMYNAYHLSFHKLPSQWGEHIKLNSTCALHCFDF
jgi:hypothetical protein